MVAAVQTVASRTKALSLSHAVHAAVYENLPRRMGTAAAAARTPRCGRIDRSASRVPGTLLPRMHAAPLSTGRTARKKGAAAAAPVCGRLLGWPPARPK